MKITILTLFPEMFEGPFTLSIIKRAKEKGLIEIAFVNIREFGETKHQIVDSTPYGGGVGMVMKVDVVHKAIEHAKANSPIKTPVILSDSEGSQTKRDSSTSSQNDNKTRVILMTASGTPYKQQQAQEYSELDHLIIICGHYEGIDARIKHYIDEEVSIGDFVLTGGELPAMMITDSVVRLLEGVITEGATTDESFSQNGQILLEYPHYTKPQEYDGHTVPDVLLSGNHAKIKAWREEQALAKTKQVRPELVEENT